MTKFAIVWILDEVFYNIHNFEEKIKEKGLENVLLSVITQRKPPEKLREFWNEMTEKLGIEKLYILTPSGEISHETWHPYEFWSAPGIIVITRAGEREYFKGNKTDVEKYGWRLGSLEDVQVLGLRQVEGPPIFPECVIFKKAQLPKSTSQTSSVPSIYVIKEKDSKEFGMPESKLIQSKKPLLFSSSTQNSIYPMFRNGRRLGEIPIPILPDLFENRLEKSHRDKGEALLKLGRYEEALQSYEVGINLGDKLTHVEKGDALRMLKRYDEALESYEIALGYGDSLRMGRSTSTYNITYQRKIEVLCLLNCYEEALEQLLPYYVEGYYRSPYDNYVKKIKDVVDKLLTTPDADKKLINALKTTLRNWNPAAVKMIIYGLTHLPTITEEVLNVLHHPPIADELPYNDQMEYTKLVKSTIRNVLNSCSQLNPVLKEISNEIYSKPAYLKK